MPGIEFIEPPDDRREPEPARVARAPRRWWLLGVAAVALGAVVFALTRPTARTPQAVPEPVPSAHSSTFSLPDHPLGTPSATASGDACSTAPECAVSFIVPARLSAALHSHLMHLGGLRVESSLAQSLSTAATYLAQRTISIENTVTLMKISVHRIAGPAPAVEPAALGVIQLRVTTDAFVIDVAAYPTAHEPPTRAQLRALANDPALEVI